MITKDFKKACSNKLIWPGSSHQDNKLTRGDSMMEEWRFVARLFQELEFNTVSGCSALFSGTQRQSSKGGSSTCTLIRPDRRLGLHGVGHVHHSKCRHGASVKKYLILSSGGLNSSLCFPKITINLYPRVIQNTWEHFSKNKIKPMFSCAPIWKFLDRCHVKDSIVAGPV